MELTPDTAYLIDGNELYFARVSRAPHEPDSAVFRLVQGLWERYGTDTIRRVRKPILMLGPESPLDPAVVRVAAKRLTRLSAEEASALDLSGLIATELESPPLPPEPLLPEGFTPSLPILSESQGITLVRLLAASVPTGPSRSLSARRIGAALVGPRGDLLAWSTNTAGTNRTRHAEINCLQTHWRKTQAPLPAGATLYVSLKPCKMCAAAAWVAAADLASFSVIYDELDPGPLARATMLDADPARGRRAIVRQATGV